MTAVPPFNTSRSGAIMSALRPAKQSATPFESLIEKPGTSSDERAHGFSDLGMFGRTSAAASDRGRAPAHLQSLPLEKPSATESLNTQKPSLHRMASAAVMIDRLASAPAARCEVVTRSAQLSSDIKGGPEYSSTLQASLGGEGEDRPEEAGSPVHRSVPEVRNRPAPIALHMADNGEGLQIAARLPGIVPEERERLRALITRVATDAGHEIGALLLNGLPENPSNPQAIGGRRGARSR